MRRLIATAVTLIVIVAEEVAEEPGWHESQVVYSYSDAKFNTMLKLNQRVGDMKVAEGNTGKWGVSMMFDIRLITTVVTTTAVLNEDALLMNMLKQTVIENQLWFHVLENAFTSLLSTEQLTNHIPVERAAPSTTNTLSTPKTLLCDNQKRLQQMADDCSPTLHHTFLPDLESWTQHKLVKPRLKLLTSPISNCNNSNVSIYEIVFQKSNLHSIKNFFYLLSYSIFITAMLCSVVHRTKALYSFAEKQLVNISSPVSNPNENYLFSDLRSLKRFQPHDTDSRVYTVADFADNHNPALTISLQQQLDAMSPREFLPYVLNDLTLDERESLMIDEGQRRKTFLVNWPHEKNLSGIRMAQAGFYCVNDYDRVQCVFCRGSLHKWEVSDVPINEHQKLFPFCRFVKGLECGNREYRSKKMTADDRKNITTYLPESGNGRDGMADNISLGISTNRAAIPQYAPESARLSTYRRWPSKAPIKPEDLCKAGFFYTGFDDQVRCFFCSGGLRDWCSNDKPWEEHARWFPECLYLVHEKGLEYINDIHDKTADNRKSVRKTKYQKKQDEQKKDTMSMQEEMFALCQKLGHPTEYITKAIEMNGKPFDTISELLKNVTDLEDMGTLPTSELTKTVTIDKPDCPVVEQQSSIEEMQGSRYDSHKMESKRELGCWNCAAKMNKFTLATHIGMPCGHLILCDQCNEEEKRKTTRMEYKVICPYEACGTPLSGAMKVYLA